MWCRSLQCLGYNKQGLGLSAVSYVCVYSVSLPFLLCVIIAEIIKFNNAYSEKLQSHVQKEKDLITLSWKVKELTELDQNGRPLHSELLGEIDSWYTEGATIDDVIERLRLRLHTVPPGYTIHSWIEGVMPFHLSLL